MKVRPSTNECRRAAWGPRKRTPEHGGRRPGASMWSINQANIHWNGWYSIHHLKLTPSRLPSRRQGRRTGLPAPIISGPRPDGADEYVPVEETETAENNKLKRPVNAGILFIPKAHRLRDTWRQPLQTVLSTRQSSSPSTQTRTLCSTSSGTRCPLCIMT